MRTDLIFDVGMHNGDDTAYYLAKGFRVLAIEANPALIAPAQQRFADQIEKGKLVLLNVGIERGTGDRLFWVNLQQSELSSFDKQMASRFGGVCEAINVACVSFQDLLDDYGVPYYLKIDIEGADVQCLRALTPSDLPQYVSVEAHSLTPLFLLQELGYDAFKCINQLHHANPRKGINTASELFRAAYEFWGALKSSVRFRAKSTSISRMLWNGMHQLSKATRHRAQDLTALAATTSNGPLPADPDDTAPISHGTGPFGEETIGAWRSFEETAYDWLHIKMRYPMRSTLTHPGWYDFHAKRTYSAI